MRLRIFKKLAGAAGVLCGAKIGYEIQTHRKEQLRNYNDLKNVLQ